MPAQTTSGFLPAGSHRMTSVCDALAKIVSAPQATQQLLQAGAQKCRKKQPPADFSALTVWPH